MKVRIHRGAKQIGGTCIEVESQGKLVLLDIGQPLDCPDAALAEMPKVVGLEKPDPSLLGIVLSHPHLDHYGLAYRVPSSIPVLMGAAAERILAAAAVFTPAGGTFKNVIHLVDQIPITLGPFTIKPFLVDHSAYDAYAVLVEADGKTLFYTGDLRGHGRKAKLFERLVKYPPKDVDVLLMEGTTITRAGTDQGFPTEADLEMKLTKIFKETKGLPLVWCSGMNIDFLVTAYRAAKRSGRHFIMDMYAAHILAATENRHLPQSSWKDIHVYLPKSQKMKIFWDKAFDITHRYRPARIFDKEIAAVANRSVMLFRPSMRGEVERMGCLDGACLVYSLWDGYWDDEKLDPFKAWLKQHGIQRHVCHTSGHASLRDLKRLRSAFSQAVVVPIHCDKPELFEQSFDNVVRHADNKSWEVT